MNLWREKEREREREREEGEGQKRDITLQVTDVWYLVNMKWISTEPL